MMGCVGRSLTVVCVVQGFRRDGGDVFKLVASAAGVGDKAPFPWAGAVGGQTREREMVCVCKGKEEGLGGRCRLM